MRRVSFSRWLRFTDRQCELAYCLALATAVLFKLWLIQSEEIVGFWAEYDALWYLKSASHWYWNAPYSAQAFFRTPGYPLFVALTHAIGMPLRIGIEVFQITGYLLVVHAMRSLRCPRWLCLGVFIITVSNPCSFQLNNQSMSDTAYAGAITWLVAAMILTLARRDRRSAFLGGAMFAFTWISREETFLLLPVALVFVCFIVARELSDPGMLKVARSRSYASLITFLVTSFCLIGTVYFVNYLTFGSFSNSDMTSPAFRAAYRSLTRIKPAHVIRYVPITHESLQMAYMASPTFASLEPQFEGPVGAHWKKFTAKQFGTSVEIGGAWFRFALRDAAKHAGFYRNPATAAQFFATVAREVNQACDEHHVPSRPVFSTFLDPGALSFAGELPRSFSRVVSVLFNRYSMSFDREDDTLPAERQRLYDQMCLRRASLTSTAYVVARFTSTNIADPIVWVTYDTDRQTGMPYVARSSQSNEVTSSKVENVVEFEVTLHTYHAGPVPGRLVFLFGSGKVFTIAVRSLTSSLPGDQFKGSTSPIKVISLGSKSSYNPKSVSAENWIGRNYRKALYLLVTTAVLGAIACVTCFRRSLVFQPLFGAVAILFVAVVGRIALFTYLDANYYNVLDPRFIFPIMGLCWTLLAIIGYLGGKQVVSRGFARLL